MEDRLNDSLTYLNKAMSQLFSEADRATIHVDSDQQAGLARVIAALAEDVIGLSERVPAWLQASRSAREVPQLPEGYYPSQWLAIVRGGRAGYPVWWVESVAHDEPAAGDEPEADVAIYLDKFDESQLAAIEAAAEELAALLGYGDFTLVEERRGSIFKSWRGKLQGGLASDRVQSRLAEIEQRLTLEAVGRAQAEVDSKVTESAVTLIESLGDIPNAVVRVGALMVIKYTPDGADTVLLLRHLTSAEVRALERNPGIQSDPVHALELLAVAVQQLQSADSAGDSTPGAF